MYLLAQHKSDYNFYFVHGEVLSDTISVMHVKRTCKICMHIGIWKMHVLFMLLSEVNETKYACLLGAYRDPAENGRKAKGSIFSTSAAPNLSGLYS